MAKTVYQKKLDRLASLLRKSPLTAKAISAALKCCRPTAYQRLEALRERGAQVYTFKVRESDTGPMSLAYGIR